MKKGIYISGIPEELADLWRLQAFIERRHLKDIIVDAMEMYIDAQMKKDGYYAEVEAVEEVPVDISVEDINWDILERAGVDVEELKKEIQGKTPAD